MQAKPDNTQSLVTNLLVEEMRPQATAGQLQGEMY
jgi:hypothetical protein